MVNLADFTLSSDCLPPPQPLSPDQRSLITHLLQVSNNIHLAPKLFIENLACALVLFGDCRGLARISRDGGGTILCSWLRSEIALSFNHNPQGQPINTQLLGLVDHIDFALLSLRGDPRWQFLFEVPWPSLNRLVHFQLAISGSPAYHLVAAKLHRGICSKIKQLHHLDIATFNRRFGGFVNPLIRIVRNIPEAAIQGSLHEYHEGEFDNLVQDVIFSMPRKEISSDGRTVYAPKTIRKFISTWITAFYGTASERAFVGKKYQPRTSLSSDPIDAARADELSVSHTLRHVFIDFADQQNQREEVDLSNKDDRVTRSKVPRNLLGSGLRKIPMGKAANLFTPSKTIPGVLSLPAIAIMVEGLERLAEFYTEPECSAARILVDLMLHIGRRPEWLLTLEIGDGPTSVWETRNPRWRIGSRVIYHVPEIYVCPPTRALGESKVINNLKVDDAVTIYEGINQIYQIPIPQQIACLMSAFLQTRNQVIDNNPEAAARLNFSHDSGPFFIVERDQNLVSLSEGWVDNLFAFLSDFLQGYIPGHPNLRVSHFIRSFEGIYASLGLRGVYRHYMSGRVSRTNEMPLRYSRVSIKGIDAEYSSAYAHYIEMIHAESQKLFGETYRKLNFEDRVSALESQDLRQAFFGTTKVPSRSILRAILGSLHADIEHAEFDVRKGSRTIALTRLIVVALGLFNGLRPFEVTRLNRRSFDMKSCVVTVKGKARWGRQVYRCLPLLPEIVILIDELLNLLGEDMAPGKRLFSLNQKGQVRPALSTKDLDQILECAAIAAGWSSGPIFYGLRHRFRTDMLSLGMVEGNINYLMGHEIIGQEAFSIYSEQHYESLVGQYLMAAGEMVRNYGFQ